MTTVIGLDLSLTSTGIAMLAPDNVKVTRLPTTGRKDATLADRRRRLRRLVDSIEGYAIAFDADLIAIEGPSHGQARQGGQHDRAGLWWLVVDQLSNRWNIVEIPPSCRAKYATGKGNAAKDAVLAAVVRRYPTVDVTGNDEADALVLAAMAARHLGAPIEPSLPLVNLAAMDAVRWPEIPARTGAVVRSGRNYDAETVNVAGGFL